MFIFLFLVITSDVSENIRIFTNLLGFAIPGFLFVKEYGFDFRLYPKIPNALTSFILFYSAALLLSSVYSANVSLSLTECLRQFSFFILLFFFYALIRNGNYLLYVYALMLSGVFISLTIIYSFLFLSNQVTLLQTLGAVHEGGYIKNVAAAGGILIASISFTLSESFNKKNKYQILVVSCLILQIAGLLLTGSRAAYLGTTFSMAFILFTLKRRMLRNIIAPAVIIIFILLFISPAFFEVIFSFLRGGRVFSNNRYVLWPIAVDIIKDNPIFGVGPGMFKYYIYKYIPVMLGSWDEQQIRWLYENVGSGHAHNFFLFLSSEMGLFGLLSAIGLPVTFFYLVRKAFTSLIEKSGDYFMLIVITGTGIGFLVRSFFESTGFLSYGWITRDLPFWIVFILLISVYNKINYIKVNALQ